MDPFEYKRYLDFAFDAYQNHNVTNQAFRQAGKVPYFNHPCWCGTMLLHDTCLPWEIRERGFKALLLHDVKEDTKAEFPKWISSETLQDVRDMTFKNFAASIPEIPKRSPFIKLLFLVDKLSTLIEEHLADDPEKRHAWKDMVLYLSNEVEKHYGRTRIVAMAQAMANVTPW